MPRAPLSPDIIAEIRDLKDQGVGQRAAKAVLDQKHGGHGPSLASVAKYFKSASAPSGDEPEDEDSDDILPTDLPDGLPDDRVRVVHDGLRAEVEALRQELRDSRKDSLAKLQNRSELSGLADLNRDQLQAISARIELANIEKRLGPGEPSPVALMAQLDDLQRRKSEPYEAQIAELAAENQRLKMGLSSAQAVAIQAQSSVEIERLRADMNLKILTMEKSMVNEKLEVSKFWLEAAPKLVSEVSNQIGVHPGELRDSIRFMASALNVKIGGHFTEDGRGVSIPPPGQRSSGGSSGKVVVSGGRPGQPPQEVLAIPESMGVDLFADDLEEEEDLAAVREVAESPSSARDRRVIVVGGDRT